MSIAGDFYVTDFLPAKGGKVRGRMPEIPCFSAVKLEYITKKLPPPYTEQRKTYKAVEACERRFCSNS